MRKSGAWGRREEGGKKFQWLQRLPSFQKRRSKGRKRCFGSMASKWRRKQRRRLLGLCGRSREGMWYGWCLGKRGHRRQETKSRRSTSITRRRLKKLIGSMKKIEFNEEFFFVHPHGLYLEGAQMALPGLRFIVDRPGLNSTAALLQDARTQAELPAGARLLLMKHAPKIEFLAREHGWRLVSVSSELNRRFENKLTIGTGFAQANLPSLQFEVSRPKDLSWEDVLERLGTKLVVQTERGHAGSGSYLIDSEDEWKRLVVGQGDYETKVMPFVEGETWTLNACVTHYR